MIEQIKSLTWKGWGIIAAMVFLIISIPSIVYYSLDIGAHTTLYSPWTHAAEISTEESIEAFRSVNPESDIYLKYRLRALIGILIFFILGPGLLIILGIRSSSDYSEGDKKPSMLFKTGLAFTLVGLLNLGLEVGISPIVYKNTRESAAVSAQKDQMRNEMAKLGWTSYEYFVLPDSLKGGDGNFEGISKANIADELEFQTKAYELQTVSDTLLKISGRKPVSKTQTKEDTVRLVLHVHPSPILSWQDSP